MRGSREVEELRIPEDLPGPGQGCGTKKEQEGTYEISIGHGELRCCKGEMFWGRWSGVCTVPRLRGKVRSGNQMTRFVSHWFGGGNKNQRSTQCQQSK